MKKYVLKSVNSGQYAVCNKHDAKIVSHGPLHEATAFDSSEELIRFIAARVWAAHTTCGYYPKWDGYAFEEVSF